ncbi:hypothetical protein LTR37_017933 [Vermiconidia calcicola]|uniref:Uncharacterized protein n=1 Tax=Vermiconidia calcicola TaxID=1690605 RepID=A0ACC3MK41_9PEZI|nr:hypothetical protein LTR37_017933 [Vermiconidia calcicola]
MQDSTSQADTIADLDATNPILRFERHDAFGDGANEPDAGSKTTFGSTSTQMGADRTISTSLDVSSEDIGNQASNQPDRLPNNGKQSTQDVLLQIPPNGGASRRPTESAIWGWDTPLESIGESSSYYYEPQGELLKEQLEQQPVRNEFSIPHAVSSSNSSGAFPAVQSSAANAFTVPQHPPGVPPRLAGVKRKSFYDREGAVIGNRPQPKRSYRTMSELGEELGTSVDPGSHARNTRTQGVGSGRPRSVTEGSEGQGLEEGDSARTQADTAGPQRTLQDHPAATVLPARKVFPIQIGDKLFRLSGASISSDAPSYFSQFFEEQLRQSEGADSGYHIEPRDGPHFVKLFADAQFFSLPRLTSQLFSSTIYIRIGDSEFQIPRDLFSSPGDSPNYFSLGFAIFFTTPTEVFPGLSQRTLLRPPSILPPSVPNRSARTFADILHILKGYPVEIRSEEHRTELLRDARYFHLKGLEQRLIPQQISYNLARKKSEIVIRLEDIRQSGVSFVADGAALHSGGASPASSTSSTTNGPGWIYYQRPYVDSEACSLVVEIHGNESAFLSIAPGPASSIARVGRAAFQRETLARITSLFSVIANKMNLPITQPLGLMMMERGAGVASLPVSPSNTGVSEERVKVRIGADADVTLNGRKWVVGEGEEDDDDEESGMDVDPSEAYRSGSKKRKRNAGERDEGEEWVLKKGQWRLRVQSITGGVQSGRSGMEVILGAVKIDAYSDERARNSARGFLV